MVSVIPIVITWYSCSNLNQSDQIIHSLNNLIHMKPIPDGLLGSTWRCRGGCLNTRRNFFQFFNNLCSYFDMIDGYLRFISTVGQTTVPFFFRVVIFSGCNLNPPKNMAGQMTVPFFLVVIFSVVCKYHSWCSCQNMNTNYDPKKTTTGKKGTVVWPAMFFEPPEKIMTPPKKGTVVWPTVEINLR